MASNDLGAAYATAAVKVADIAPKIQTLPTKIEARKGKNMVSFLQKRILLAAEKDHAHQVVRHCETSFTVFFYQSLVLALSSLFLFALSLSNTSF